MQLEPAPVERETRARRSRAEEVLPERRKRIDIATTGKRLAVPTHLLDHEKYVYRFFNDSDTRLMQMTQHDDWDIMANDGGIASTDLGNAITRPVGVRPDGSPMKAYLCRKLRKFYEEDQKMKQTDLDEQLARLRQGNDADGGSQGDYIPSGGIRIARS